MGEHATRRFAPELATFMDALRIDWRTRTDAPTPTLHHLPCQVAHTGPAKVSTFFLVQQAATSKPADVIAQNANNTAATVVAPDHSETTEIAVKQAENGLETSFRGRYLGGSTVKLPPGYEGVLLDQVALHQGGAGGYVDYEQDGDVARAILRAAPLGYRARARFTEWTRWWPDQEPDAATDPWQRPLEWLRLSDMIHLDDDDNEDAAADADDDRKNAAKLPTDDETRTATKRKQSGTITDVEERVTRLRVTPVPHP
ncbi:ribonuclease H2 non-catalytic subunit-domain-containing protein [Thamnocephalis sphaerospora]|uniref:Ribonuclease H2 non-catalytic subunit-domain-containing protein n=1 Tax=Thamnocephalis sphaerospora TaxID=78915 RepID=A0A4P9XJX9_9FUNG|nr:ribonuclease H2 non-catalytic subunit-domain-containing protein [Thamnocephalis sphaerospora]|eukprot:RKP06098.1 ribonuclease H2 non-catalytic subunit-domain-containing protein [Thamnocephalis sphaerospora]